MPVCMHVYNCACTSLVVSWNSQFSSLMLATENHNRLITYREILNYRCMYRWRCLRVLSHLIFGFYFYVSQAGVKVADPEAQVFNWQEVEVWPRIAWKPKWALTFADVKKKVSGSFSVSQRSTMVIKGRNIFVEDLSLDGAVLVDAIDDAEVCCV